MIYRGYTITAVERQGLTNYKVTPPAGAVANQSWAEIAVDRWVDQDIAYKIQTKGKI